MPANYSHFRFGKEVFEKLENQSIKKLIIDNLDLFLIGLHGPDILFYHYPLKSNEIKSYGHNMHDIEAYDFFLENKTSIPEKMAYLYGFICHFTLDSQCHGLVEDCVEKTGRSHYEVEAQLEKYLMIKDGVDYKKVSTAMHIYINEMICEVIADTFCLSSEAIRVSLESMKHYHNILIPGVLKDPLIKFALTVSGQGSLKGLMVNQKTLSKDERNNEQLYAYYLKAIDQAVLLIDNYDKYLHEIEQLDNYFHRNYV